MHQPDEPALENYPHGRGYGHDYMRGGEVFGGYGYAERDEYSKPRGDLDGDALQSAAGHEQPNGHSRSQLRT